jgi:hypothetical protein
VRAPLIFRATFTIGSFSAVLTSLIGTALLGTPLRALPAALEVVALTAGEPNHPDAVLSL